MIIRRLIMFGFVLYLYDGVTHLPVNKAPFHVFDNIETCEADKRTWLMMAPEWLGACREQQGK